MMWFGVMVRGLALVLSGPTVPGAKVARRLSVDGLVNPEVLV
jgi:hypothetical protein